MRVLLLLTSLVALGFQKISAQTFCHTPATSSNIELFRSFLTSKKSTTVYDYYELRIYVHVIRRSNGTGGQSVNDVNTALSFLNSDFNQHGIYFILQGNIDYIDNDIYYNTPTSSIFSVNSHTDGIDIYLYNDAINPGNGLANGVGQSSEYYVAGSFWNYPYGSLVKSHVISHEMGHVLFLWHTHHGTYYEGGDPYQCAELVDGSNSDICGDYIADTPADPYLNFDVSYTTCTWNSSGTDANGDSYNPDETMIMSYTHPDCMSYFSEEQGDRMITAINSLTFLQNCVTCEETIISNRTITSDEIILGCDISVENVTIQNNSNVVIYATNSIIIENDFEVQVGSTLEVK